MTRLEKRLVVIVGLAVVAAGVFVVRAMIQPGLTGRVTVNPAPGQTSGNAPAPAPATKPAQPADAEVKPGTMTAAADAQADSTRNELLKLSGLVNVAAAPYVPPDKDQWRQALPLARDLAQGTCDCAQRSWLNTFIAMGNFALAGDEENFRKYGKIMATLGRSNDESAAFLQEQHDLAAQRAGQEAQSALN